jgi:hypothetical protein
VRCRGLTVCMMINRHAAFLSLPPSRMDSPVRTRLSGILFSTMDRDRANARGVPASIDGRRRGIGAVGVEGDEPKRGVDGEVPKRDEKEEPKYEVLGRGDEGDMGLNGVEGGRGD